MPVPGAGSEPEAWLRLALTPGLGPVGQRQLLSLFGSPAAVLQQSVSSLSRVVGASVAAALAGNTVAAEVTTSMAWLAEPGNHLLTLADEDYPKALLETADPPAILFLKGRRELLSRPALAIVGSRNATPVGMQTAEAFAAALSAAGFCIVSGMALGIDTAAHRGGLSGSGASIAVVGTGLDLVYPARNKALAHDLAAKGLIVSEFALGTPAIAGHFPRRNRIISGLARGVLVVEAALASGSLITARLAGEQGREVFAIPGSIHSPFSKGCHQLIKQGAKLVDDANDILVELGWNTRTSPPSNKAAAAIAPDADDALLTAMGYDPVTIDQLASRSGQSAGQIAVRLTELELEGVIASLPGGQYQRMGG
jgi:DNA processing protein